MVKTGDKKRIIESRSSILKKITTKIIKYTFFSYGSSQNVD